MTPTNDEAVAGRRLPHATAVAAGIATGVAVVFAFLALAVAGSGPLPLDDGLSAAVAALPVPEGIWLALTDAGGGPTLVVVGTGLAIAVLASGRPRIALLLAVVMIAMALGTDLMKDLTARPRPIGAPVDRYDGLAFPSGHTLHATVVYGLVALVLWRSAMPRLVRIAAVCVAAALAILVGLSRVALGVHHPTDVIGGWLAGAFLLATTAVAIAVLDRPVADEA